MEEGPQVGRVAQRLADDAIGEVTRRLSDRTHGTTPRGNGTGYPAALRCSSSLASLLYSVLRLIPSSAAAAGLLPLCLSSTRRMCSISISSSVRAAAGAGAASPL